MTEFVDVPGGRIAYDVNGSGPLVVLSHGIGDEAGSLLDRPVTARARAQPPNQPSGSTR